MNPLKSNSLWRRIFQRHQIPLLSQPSSCPYSSSYHQVKQYSLTSNRRILLSNELCTSSQKPLLSLATLASTAHPTPPESSYNLIKCSQQDGLRTIMMNDKKTRNALSLQMMQELTSAISSSKSDPNLRCILLTASTGTPVFSSGHNLKELTSENGVPSQKNIFATCTELMLAIRQAEVPVFVVVRGLAAAAGCQLVAACDFAIVSDKASFSTPGAAFGLFCSTPGVAVSRAANRTTAAYMVLTGQALTATEALNAGLVTKVVPEDKLDSCINEIYASIKSKSRSVIHLGKQFFYEQLEMSYDKALSEGENTMVRNLQLKDCQEGLQSFKEKRHPVWSHSDNGV